MSNIVVIGASSGIGEAIAEKLGSGVDTVYLPDAREIDVNNSGDFYDWIVRRHMYVQGPEIEIDSLVYSAGINGLEWIGSLDMIEVDDIINTNLTGFLNVLNDYKKANDEFWGGKPRRVVVVTSDAAVRPLRTSIAYCASKAGLDMAVKVAARELGTFGWAVNAVAPGMTEGTGMTAQMDKRIPEVRGWTPEFAAAYEQQQAVASDRVTRADIAQVVRKLLEMPMIVNGAIIPVNGGR